MIAATAETAAAAINQCVKEAIVSVLLSMDFTTESIAPLRVPKSSDALCELFAITLARW